MQIFRAPTWLPKIEPIPDHVPISEFILNEKYGRVPIKASNRPYVDGLSNLSYTTQETIERVDYLARSLKKLLGLRSIREGNEENGFNQMEKVICAYSVNCVDYSALSWSIQRLNGIISPANAAFPTDELTYQLKNCGAKLLFTCVPLLDTAINAAGKAGIPRENIYLLKTPDVLATKEQLAKAKEFRTLDDLINDGRSLEQLEELNWSKGFARRKIAFLCYSSGTSGLPKGVMIAHSNVMTNVRQGLTLMSTYRDVKSGAHNVLGLLPQSHIYALVVIMHAEVYCGNSVVLLPKFEMQLFLNTIQKYKLHFLFVVPPIIIALAKNKAVVDKYDISSAKFIMTGAAPMTSEISEEMNVLYPNLKVLQGYGMTESSCVVSNTSALDIWHGSSGFILPNTECRIVSPEGKDLGEGELGELLVRGDNVTLGYLNNEKATNETFQDGWLRSGDEAILKRSVKGNLHLFVVDRLKDLVKVKAHQVAPAEIEGHLLKHPKVADCAVIPVADEKAGELPKAFVVLHSGTKPSEEVAQELKKWVADHKAHYKRLEGGVEFIDVIPKNPSGKILRRLLRDKEREKRKRAGSKL